MRATRDQAAGIILLQRSAGLTGIKVGSSRPDGQRVSADLIYADGLGSRQGFFGVIMFEKKYWRAQSYSSLSVLVKKVEGEDHTRVTIVSSTERQDRDGRRYAEIKIIGYDPVTKQWAKLLATGTPYWGKVDLEQRKTVLLEVFIERKGDVEL